MSIQTSAVHMSLSSLPAISPQTGTAGVPVTCRLDPVHLLSCTLKLQTPHLPGLHLVSLLGQVFHELRGRAALRCKSDIVLELVTPSSSLQKLKLLLKGWNA